MRPAEQPGGGLDVAVAIAARTSELRTGPAVELERRHDDDLEAARPAELRECLGRPGALEAERGVGRHQEARDRRAFRDLADERLVRRLAQPHVEVDDDGRGHAGLGQPRHALVRVAQERRRRAGEDLVRVVVERDHGRPGAARGGLAHEVLEEVDVAQVEPVEHADDDEQRLVGRGQAREAAGVSIVTPRPSPGAR